MKLKDLLTEVRSRLDDQAAPFLWADSELTGFLNEAQSEASVRANLIYDETSPVTEIEVEAGTALYKHSPLIKSVDRVVLGSTQRPLDRFTQPQMDVRQPSWRRDTGRPSRFCEEQTYLLLHPTPTDTDLLRLAVWRLPREALEQECDEPEIEPRYHLLLLDWVLFRAYNKRDSDGYNPALAATHEGRFTASFGERPDANVQRQRKIRRVPVVRPRW